MKSQRSLDSTRLLVGLSTVMSLAGTFGVLTKPSVALSQGIWVNPPQQCDNENDKGYGQVCNGPVAFYNDAGVLINFNDGGECCEGICGGWTPPFVGWDPTYGLVYYSFPMCCGTNGDTAYWGQSVQCIHDPSWDTLCVGTGGPGELQDFLCCSGAAVWAPNDAGVACQCIGNGDSPGKDSNGNQIATAWACCSDIIEWTDAGLWVCEPAPEFHSCQTRLGCAYIDGVEPACYEPTGAQFGICIPPTLCNDLYNLPDSGVPNCNIVPCCGNETCIQSTGQCVPRQPCLLPDSGPCALNALTEACCGPNYDGGNIVHQADGGWGYFCDPATLVCKPAVGPDAGCVGDNGLDSGSDPNYLSHSGQGDCMLGLICDDGDSDTCNPIHYGDCCSLHEQRTQCQYPLECAVAPVPVGKPDGGDGPYACSDFTWDPEGAACCKEGGYFLFAGTTPQCVNSWDCCDGQCNTNPNAIVFADMSAPLMTCDGIPYPLCAEYGFQCKGTDDCCQDVQTLVCVDQNPVTGFGGCVPPGAD